ncbi:MAG: hypothetical protein ABIN37_07405 [Burkholderiaceae bacterium]
MMAGAASAALLDYDEYLQRGNAAKARGDWQSAASQFAQAINHPDLPKSGNERVQVLVEYGRAVGVLCQYSEAETFLMRAKGIAEASGSSAFGVLYELGAISVAQKKLPEAAGYFSLLMPVIERESRARVSPAIVADAYEKYGLVLSVTGKPEEAETRKREALGIREKNPKPAPAGTITPYGEKCPKS